LEILPRLIEGKKKSDRLFPFGRFTAYRFFRRAAEAAGLPKNCRGPHSTKHSILQAAVDAGATLPQVLQIGGHREIESSRRYWNCSQAKADSFRLNLRCPNGAPKEDQRERTKGSCQPIPHV